MTFLSLLSFAAAMMVLAASPGPGVFATVARSLASGFRPALAVILGIVVGDIIYLLFAIFGLSIVARSLEQLFIFVRIAGGIYLFWLGLKIWFSKPPEKVSQQLLAPPSQPGNILSGLVITLSNPKVVLFYCGFLPTFIDLSVLELPDIFLIGSVVAIVLSAVLMTYAYMASRARQLFSSQKAVKRLNRSAGGVMMVTGVTIATRG